MDQATARRQLEEIERIEGSTGKSGIPVWIDVVVCIVLGILAALLKYQLSTWVLVVFIAFTVAISLIEWYMRRRRGVRPSMLQSPAATGSRMSAPGIIGMVAVFTVYYWLPAHSWPWAVVAGVCMAAFAGTLMWADRREGNR